MAKGSKEKLGRGLDALWFDNSTSDGTSTIQLRISEIEPNRSQPRRRFDENSLTELADSIRQHGVLQPLMVRPLASGGYQIVAGERRWRACRMANITEVPAIVREMTDQEVMEIALIENIQREDLNPIEEAMAYQRLVKEYSLKQDEVAERVSKSRTAITNSLRLLKLDERVQEMLIEENISSGHARALLAIKDNDSQYNIAMKIFDEKLSVRETEKLIKSLDKKETPKKKKEELKNDFVYRDLEEQLKMIIGTKVTINRRSEQAGKIEIEYYTPEDLEKIVALLNN